MRTRIQKWGNSLALRIPRYIAIEIGLRKETPVDVSLTDGKVVISPVAGPETTLEQLLSRVTERNVHHEFDTGPATGKETW